MCGFKFDNMMRFLRAFLGGSLWGSTPGVANHSTTPVRVAQAGPQVITDLRGFPFEVVGQSHYQDALRDIVGGYRRDSQAVEATAVIVLDPANRFDPNAVRVEIEGKTVGYIPAEKALRVGVLMREQGIKTANVEAQIRGGWRTNQYDQGHFGVQLKMPRSGWIDFGVGAEKPRTASTAPTANPRRLDRLTSAPDGPLAGQWVVLWGVPQDGIIAQEIAAAGGKVMAGIGKSTTLVVVENLPITPGMMSSASWRKIEELRAKGQRITIAAWHELKERSKN
jgi:hypothetical protein